MMPFWTENNISVDLGVCSRLEGHREARRRTGLDWTGLDWEIQLLVTEHNWQRDRGQEYPEWQQGSSHHSLWQQGSRPPCLWKQGSRFVAAGQWKGDGEEGEEGGSL